MKKQIVILSAAIACAALVGCEGMSNQASGTLGGAGAGAVIGGIAGNNIDGINTGQGAVAGALVGGLLGNQMGRQQDQINSINNRVNHQTVYVQNSNGSVTPIPLQRAQGDQWVDPRGNYYNGVPTQNQLRRAGFGF